MLPLSDNICPRCGRTMKEITMNTGRYNNREKTMICDPCVLEDTLSDVTPPYEPEAKIDLFSHLNK